MHVTNRDYEQLRGYVERYMTIKSYLQDYTRPFSILDIGANAGYFSTRARRDFHCYPVLIEKDEHPPTGLPTVRARVSGDEMYELSLSEHFDVTLCLSVLHHVKDWRKFLTGVLNMGPRVFLEVPLPDDTKCAHYDRAMEQLETIESLRGWHTVNEFESLDGGTRRLMLFRRPKNHVFTGAFYNRMARRIPHIPKAHPVESSMDAKSCRGRPWIHGINLWSFMCLGGGLPTRAELADAVYWQEGHGDIRPWNYILNHEGVTLFDPEPGHHPDDKLAWEQTKQWLLHGGAIW